MKTNSHRKIEYHLTCFIVSDSETHNTVGARHYNMTSYGLGELAGRYYRDLTPYEKNKCKKSTLVFDGEHCVSNALDF